MTPGADPQDGVPWGRPPVASIPVPPFADRDAARAFALDLSLYVAALGDDSAVSLATFVLETLLQGELDAGGVPFDPWPAPLVLRVALTTYFPAPWTPAGLNWAIAHVLGRPYVRDAPSPPDRLSWLSDPSYDAVREDGQWTVTATERGRAEVVARVDSDDDLVLYRMSFERHHPLPFGWSYDASALPALDAAATAARTAWQRHAELPYLNAWQQVLRDARQ